MSEKVPTRAEALTLLQTYNQNESLIHHGLAVEAVMRHFADLYNDADQEKWGIIGLVHDLDYEKYPDQHCEMTREILTAEKWPEEYIRAIESHGWGSCSQAEPHTILEKVLYTIDELTGLVTAAALVRPSKSILDLNIKSVKKKWNQKNFAAGVNREVIEDGARRMEMELPQVIAETINGMQKVAATIGLQGSIEAES